MRISFCQALLTGAIILNLLILYYVSRAQQQMMEKRREQNKGFKKASLPVAGLGAMGNLVGGSIVGGAKMGGLEGNMRGPRVTILIREFERLWKLCWWCCTLLFAPETRVALPRCSRKSTVPSSGASRGSPVPGVVAEPGPASTNSPSRVQCADGVCFVSSRWSRAGPRPTNRASHSGAGRGRWRACPTRCRPCADPLSGAVPAPSGESAGMDRDLQSCGLREQRQRLHSPAGRRRGSYPHRGPLQSLSSLRAPPHVFLVCPNFSARLEGQAPGRTFVLCKSSPAV